MLTCKPDGLAFDENTSINNTKEILKRNNSTIPIIGNIPSYDILHKGTHDQIHEAVKKALNEGVNIIAPGCDFYLATSIENIKIFVNAARKYTR
jgi:[methyl-Co(III) methanol-specific corrinoid protein]:coenzyme M methyltransferase